MELQQNLEKMRAQGLGVAAISYDPAPVLKNFAERRGLTFPLLSDKNSSVIRSFGILNEEVPPGTLFTGMAHPGTYIVDRTGRVLSKFFEDEDSKRYMSSEILVHQFGAAAGAAHTTTQTKHLTVSSAASTGNARPGQRIALTLDIELKPEMHVYAPGVQGYIPIEWTLVANPSITAHPVEYPKSKLLRLEAIAETVPVYTGRFRLVRDVNIGAVPPGPLTIEGTLKYQACDDRLCYLPQTVPQKWTLQVEPQDRERVPAELQRKPQ